MTVTAERRLPMILDAVEAVSVERLSPSFVRVELAGEALADFGVDGRLRDQRIKLVFPGESGRLPSFAGADDSWFSTWLERPVAERGHMRTYTVSDVRGTGAGTSLVVDFVLHEGDAGPGSSWAAAARTGDQVVVVAPRRGEPFGGIEFDPPSGAEVLLAGDETAVPAMCSILRDLPQTARGAAFLEVPVAGDVLEVRRPAGVEVVWLPRDGADHGALLEAAVARHLGAPTVVGAVDAGEVDPDLWETPSYSSSGEDLGTSTVAVGHDLEQVYAWIAGESRVVTRLRRHLVRELGMDRRQVAFMGYWRRGVAMRS